MKHLKSLWLFLSLIAGAVLGSILHPYQDVAALSWIQREVMSPVGSVFLRILFMIVLPLLFSALVLGVWELGKGRGLGKVMFRTLLWTVVLSGTSVILGVALVQIFQPGAGFLIDPEMVKSQAGALSKIQGNVAAAKPFSQAIVDLIPSNPLQAAVNAFGGEMIAFMVFSLFIGGALASSGADETDPFVATLQRLLDLSVRIVGWAMKLAPIAVFCLIFGTAFKFGPQIFASLLFYVLVVVAGLLIQQFGVYALAIKLGTGRNPFAYFWKCREVYLYAFSTASSNATLPRSLALAETGLGLRPRIARFVLTVGATANQNGTALFEGITVLFLAQVYGVDLSLGAQITVVLLSILAGVGTAGVPGGSLPLIMILLQQVGVPPEGLGLILGVDRFLDMCRTTLNVSGDLVIAALVSGSETKALEAE